NLDFNKNDITALIGPSGSGKSTYLRALNRMHDLTDSVTVNGTFMYNGHDFYAPYTITVALLQKIGIVYHQPNPFPFSLYDNVAFGVRTAEKKSKAELDEIVEKSLKQAAIWDEVKDNLHKSALSLSGGQQQRVSIARALATSPEILLLDEPTAALDPVSASKVENTMMQLRNQLTMIIVTHSMAQASRISDNTAFFMDGHLVEFNHTKKVFLDPDRQETQDYISGRFG